MTDENALSPGNFPAGSEIAFGRKSISSLANGGNAVDLVLTNSAVTLQYDASESRWIAINHCH